MNLEKELKIEALRDLRTKKINSLNSFIKTSDNIKFCNLGGFINKLTTFKKEIDKIENELNSLDKNWIKESLFSSDDIPF